MERQASKRFRKSITTAMNWENSLDIWSNFFLMGPLTATFFLKNGTAKYFDLPYFEGSWNRIKSMLRNLHQSYGIIY